MYYIFWSENETQRANWLNALECLRVSFKAALEVQGIASRNEATDFIETSEKNWYCSQIYVFLKREYAIAEHSGSVRRNSVVAIAPKSQNEGNEEGGGEPASNNGDEGG